MQPERYRSLNRWRTVHQLASDRNRGGPLLNWLCVQDRGSNSYAKPKLWRLRKWISVVIELRFLLGSSVSYPVCSGKRAIQVVKAPILGIDHHNRFDLPEAFLAGRCLEGCENAGKDERGQLSWHSNPLNIMKRIRSHDDTAHSVAAARSSDRSDRR